METEPKRPAGLWIRFCAGLIDMVLCTGAVFAVAETAAGFGVYVPIEIVVLSVYAAYTAAGVGWKGRTLGKAALGIRVTQPDGRSVGWGRASVRAGLVAVFQGLLGLPLLPIGARSSKRGWHDRLAGTVVVCQENLGRRRRIAFAGVMALVGICVGTLAFDTLRLNRMHRAWNAGADIAAGRMFEPGRDRIDAAAVGVEERQQMAAWLAEHGDDPAQTLIDLASTHQVTIIGEIHGKKLYLDLLNEVLPRLYHEAGVRTLALECCHPDQNKDLDRLVQSPQFDKELQAAIARRAVWQAWGYRGYWDALETVWRVNQSRPKGSEPLRVVGISPRFDGPSWVLLRNGPWYEKLRIVRVANTLRLLLFHDACYARNVEREAFDAGRRTVVWVGAAHARLGPAREVRRRDGTVQYSHRMGSMLFGRHGAAVGQAILHDDAKMNRVAGLIEESAKQSAKTRIAFPTANSPFAPLRDETVYDYQYSPGKGLADLASHYILLAPEEELQDCDWLEGFLTRRMLGWNRPYYEWLASGPIDDLHEGNRRLSNGIHRL